MINFFFLLKTLIPALFLKQHMCQCAILLPGSFYMECVFPEKMESLCLCLLSSFQACFGRSSDCRGTGEEGPYTHLSAFLASVIFVHSAVLEGLKKGGELVAVESQTLEIFAGL